MADKRIRLLTEQDLKFAQNLRSIAGWNQTDRDWIRMLEHSPEGCFLCEYEGEPVATATTVCYGQSLAWIGMILVHPNFRRKGIARFLLEHCLDDLLNQKRIRCVKLDASQEGQPMYEKLGFREEYVLSRWAGQTQVMDAPSPQVSKFPQHLDQQAFGADRQDYLQKLSEVSLQAIEWEAGFGMIREGSNKMYLGPIVAQTEEAGRSLVANLMKVTPSASIYWDIPEDNSSAVQLAEELHFQRERPLLRMWIGQLVASDPNLQWAISGPETG